jgi:formylglycine-generating enzyme required for sulfatase activity
MLTPGAGKSESFRDCDGCPEMVVAPAGTFTIGSAAEEIGHRPEEGPQRTVRILRPFAVGKHEVTRAQFEVFMKESGYEPGISCQVYVPASKRWERAEGKTFREPGFPQTDQDPVVCVSWNDAQAYASWLSNKTGKRYRLLSEAEWEYVARAGSTGPYWWGPSASHNEANFGRDPCCGPLKEGRDQWDHTSPVGRFPANPFGLYDVLGNVWEWVEDCWNGNYEGMPTDGSARTGGDCTRRIFRGGSIYSDPSNLRAAYRSRNAPTIRPPNFGMRIARTLD